MAQFVAVAHEDDIPEGAVKGFTVGEEEIAVARCDGEIYAVNNVCTHAYTFLSEGEVDPDDCTIECPLHGARFDLATGRVRALPASEPVQTYEVRVVDGQIEVAVEQ